VRNIFLFIRRYANFLLFLVLQMIALWFLFTFNKTHEAAFNGVANELTGRVNERYNRVQYYFRLQKTNDELVKENLALRSLLKTNYEAVDTSVKHVVDSIRIDSVLKFRKYFYLEAKVVGSFVSTQTNYFTLHRGSDQGVKKDMGVIGPNGIVGRVVNTSPNFSTVMSVLNRQFKVDAKLKKSGERGRIEWEGDDPTYIYMRNIPKSTKLVKGDSVLTSELSSIFPPNIMVGTVESIVNDKSSNFFTIKLKTATNFLNVQYVYVVGNDQLGERLELEKNTKNN
jgi:rod shape-determining protein MreC